MSNSHKISKHCQCQCQNSPLQCEQKQIRQSLGRRTGAWDEPLYLSNTGEPLQKWCTSPGQQSLILPPRSHPTIWVNTLHRNQGRKKWIIAQSLCHCGFTLLYFRHNIQRIVLQIYYVVACFHSVFSMLIPCRCGWRAWSELETIQRLLCQGPIPAF